MLRVNERPLDAVADLILGTAPCGEAAVVDGSAIGPGQDHLIGLPDRPDHRSVGSRRQPGAVGHRERNRDRDRPRVDEGVYARADADGLLPAELCRFGRHDAVVRNDPADQPHVPPVEVDGLRARPYLRDLPGLRPVWCRGDERHLGAARGAPDVGDGMALLRGLASAVVLDGRCGAGRIRRDAGRQPAPLVEGWRTHHGVVGLRLEKDRRRRNWALIDERVEGCDEGAHPVGRGVGPVEGALGGLGRDLDLHDGAGVGPVAGQRRRSTRRESGPGRRCSSRSRARVPGRRRERRCRGSASCRGTG